ncbi:MAG TPA: DUF6266 family protein [Pedobacter sp.]|uniref:DUF6266 family protein n=1 Tax=Pedobacter sp. TaxID=1411316 RepID=UPI002B76A6DC|nr:DUF6266 family protein [Pedobacter sp.]HMI01857.1 DUF6266 family protein [Pedobacter sp.]
MARLPKGLFGGFSGKLGDLVGYNRNGKDLVRTKGKSTKPASVKQLAVRQKISLLNTTLGAMLTVINVGFKLVVKGTDKNPFNEAVSYNFKHACLGAYPEISIDYSQLLVSQGSLPPAFEPNVNVVPGGLEFTWGLDPLVHDNILNDRAMLLIYYPDPDHLPASNENVVCVLIGAQRKALKDFIELPPAYLTAPMHCYITFVAEDGNSISNSVFI